MNADRRLWGPGRCTGWARVSGGVVAVAAVVLLSVGAGAGSASAMVVPVKGSPIGVVQPDSVRWQ